MLDARQVARTAMERMRLPFSAHKLQLSHDIAHSLLGGPHVASVRASYLAWLATLTLESEVLEGLVPLVLTGESAGLSWGEVERAISRPSALSQLYLSYVFGTPPSLITKPLTHSGPITTVQDTSNSELVRGRHLVPGIFAATFRRLTRASGHDFLERWVFEFEQLAHRYPANDGHIEYYAGDQRSGGTTNVVTRKGQLARSAYLRTISFAIEYWGLPFEQALEFASFAGAFDPFYVRMPPGPAPTWCSALTEKPWAPGDHIPRLVDALDQAIAVDSGDARLLHLNVPLSRQDDRSADLEVVTVLWSGTRPKAEDVFTFLDAGAVCERGKRGENDFWFQPHGNSGGAEELPGTRVLRALLPAFDGAIGAMHAEMLTRQPFIPANYQSSEPVIVRPRPGGADFAWSGQVIGSLHYWNASWHPFFPRGLGPASSVATILSGSSTLASLSPVGYSLARLWRLRELHRQSAYGDWEEVPETCDFLPE